MGLCVNLWSAEHLREYARDHRVLNVLVRSALFVWVAQDARPFVIHHFAGPSM